ncbi:MAG: SDR family oxidoreductase [Pseudorhodoplanes sp.]|uniref:SDR family oxidoreductase n=1 Tax=Pseudorhodoplanes sp. TaxID=1934341 RepID=UPI003D0D11F1
MTKILVLGASGLIGQFVAGDLIRRGLAVTAAARRFSAAQRDLFGEAVRETPIASLDVLGLKALIAQSGADVVVNCIGVLQDQPGKSTHEAHDGFIERLIAALCAIGRPVLLIHTSIPGEAGGDTTPFAQSKRRADGLIVESGLPHAILRPGMVIAPAPYGGSAMLRALAALPVDLPQGLAERPFRYVAVEDIADTVARIADRWKPGEPYAAVYDLMHPDPHTMQSVIARLRHWLGDVWPWRLRMPEFAIDLGAKAGDLSSWLGWSPPMRSTAIAELRRGVLGDPARWMTDIGVSPRSLDTLLHERPATVENRWFARLYLLKALIVAVLAVFWLVSGLIAITVAYGDALDMMERSGFPGGQSHAFVIVSSLTDIVVGLLIAFRRTSRIGLVAGIVVAVGYMLGTAVLTPALWIEPLGALVKTGPAIVLMMVALAISDDR